MEGVQLAKEEAVPIAFNPFLPGEQFHPIPDPTHIDDWLAQFAEKGQSFKEWNESKHVSFDYRNPNSPRKVVYVIAIGEDLAEAKESLNIEVLKEYISAFYPGMAVKELPALQVLPVDGTKVEITYYNMNTANMSWYVPIRRCHEYDSHKVPKSHRQLKVAELLQALSRGVRVPSDGLVLLALTLEDLYEGAKDSFVVGMAAGGSRVGCFSFARYNPAFPFRLSRHRKRTRNGIKQQTLLIQRSCKCLVHELAHMFGIDHCVYFSCCMQGSGHLVEDFSQPVHLCPIDLRKVVTLCKCDVVLRYEGLARFYQKNGFESEVLWIKRRMETLRNAGYNQEEVVALHSLADQLAFRGCHRM